MGQSNMCCFGVDKNQQEKLLILNEVTETYEVILEKDKIDNLIGNELMECDVSKTLQLKTFYSTKNNFLKLNNIDLSEEIVLLILSYLSMKDIVNLSILNRSFKRYWTCHPLIWNNFSLKFGFYCKNISTVQDVIDYVFKPNYLLKQSFTKAISRNVTDTFKVVLCGDEKTGKSTWLKRFLHNFYDENYRKTVGMEYFSHSLQYVESNFYAYSLRDIRVQLDLWDLGGHAKYFALFPLVTRESRGVMLCFDLSNEMSFDSIETLLNDYVKRHLHNIDGNSLNEKIKNEKKMEREVMIKEKLK
ncbi:hypothetical protein ABK040_003914 [Willaertia magna]